MAECGFCADGDQEKLLADGATEINGPMPVNTDGGLIANGEPIGASGLRQMHEMVRQLRGEAGDRQVPGNPAGRVRPGLRRARHRGGDDPDDLSPGRPQEDCGPPEGDDVRPAASRLRHEERNPPVPRGPVAAAR